MLLHQPLLLDDIDELRRSVRALEEQTGRRSELWRLLKNSARSAPMNYPWFTPFVALITQEAQDIENARQVLRTYLSKLNPMTFSTGLQFHFWCFAFPHAKWSLYFQWLCTLGAFARAEQAEMAQQLIQYHFLNFFYGLRTKPEPECVDNQALSLAFSNALVGYIFTQGDNPSKMAQRMLDDGLRRLPTMIGDMPPSGYSGEGSSYMDCVNGPAIPLAVELLQRITGETGLLYRAFTTGGCLPINVLRMVAREWMPGGLLLPWDNYGYQFGVRSPIAYAARHTGEPIFYDILEKECIWTYDIGVGWAYDDLVWTLIWWPEQLPKVGENSRSWFEPEVGGALVSGDQNFYVMQMWDESAPEIPTRAHVNPNAVLFNGYGVPLSADGSPAPEGVPRFRFADTFRQVSFLTMGGEDVYNYGDGCGGAHSIILVDDWEGLRIFGERQQFRNSTADLTQKTIHCDVTPLYQERYPDVLTVQRKSTLCAERFFAVEDWVEFAQPHRITSRFLLRPDLVTSEAGVKIQTPEGVTLHLIELLNRGQQTIHTETVTSHPFKPDRRSLIADFSLEAAQTHRLFIAWISRTIAPAERLSDFQSLPDPGADLTFASVLPQLVSSTLYLPMLLPAHMEASVPIVTRWWYRKITRKKSGKAWLKLPVGMTRPQLYLNGQPIDLSPYATSGELIAPHVPLPAHLEALDEIEIVLRTDVPISHYEGGGDGTMGMTGGITLCYPVPEEKLLSASYVDGAIRLVTDQQVYQVPYALLHTVNSSDVSVMGINR
ncbi:MAG: hypothetical protein U0175_34910 [Caldilineaceae bacterium]